MFLLTYLAPITLPYTSHADSLVFHVQISYMILNIIIISKQGQNKISSKTREKKKLRKSVCSILFRGKDFTNLTTHPVPQTHKYVHSVSKKTCIFRFCKTTRRNMKINILCKNKYQIYLKILSYMWMEFYRRIPEICVFNTVTQGSTGR